MGIGDELLAAGEAQRIRAQTGKRVRIVDHAGRTRWHSLWAGNDAIIAPDEPLLLPHETMKNHKGHRPHVLEHYPDRFVFNPSFRATSARVELTEQERAFGAQYSGAIVIEPNVYPNKPNKQWGRDNWAQLVALMHAAGFRPIQLGPRSTAVLTGVQHVTTETIRDAAAVLSTASAAVLPEGGLHHLAAALRVRAVVIFGGFISPTITGYGMHRNIFSGKEACGQRTPCQHCVAAMASVDPARVFNELKAALMTRPPA
jgi:ADP-heptose:LPS heptosyltransferase